ncbi:hypothetical protein [Thermoproteus tenax]|uniref:Class III signal peptide-containing protein n=1 Tax=Thermoproteus tenax (strain ATCC 35583 / DSM 2078 / JCM 9277 / NBRC 100435 / Kra 1) TaxID=768679 RepID=G4RJG5_THETK|nr:hypothetical protein [Thermoproteus tenax]CCC81710.1 hypothetical protein TTX_1067 [Thermoproteus tenax Kra 1]
MKGLTSIELAILLAIIIVIAVAVGWYMYTTFLSSTTGAAKVEIVSAQYSISAKNLTLQVINPGPVNNVGVASITLAGQQCSVGSSLTIPMQSSPVTITVSCGSIPAAVGSTLQGTLTLTSGASYPFVATVVS